MKKILELKDKLVYDVNDEKPSWEKHKKNYPQIKFEVQEVPNPNTPEFIQQEGVENPEPDTIPIDWPIADGKKHITFVAPFFNGTGLYRSILPMLHFNESDTHSAIITNINEYNQSSATTAQQMVMFDQFVAWSHYMIFPDIASRNMINTIRMIREINPNIILLANIDDNHFNIPETHHHRHIITKQQNSDRIDVLNCYDGLIGTNRTLLAAYYENVKQKYSNTAIQLDEVPNLMSHYTTEDIIPSEPLESEKTRILLTINPGQFHDINPFKKVLKEVQNIYKDKVELIIFGWDGKTVGANGKVELNKNALSGLNYTYIEPVNIKDYFKTLATIQPDFALMPLSTNSGNGYLYNICKSSHKFLQYSMFKIPVIAQDISTYTGLNKEGPAIHNHTCLLSKNHGEWLKNIKTLIKNKTLAKHLAETAHQITKEEYTYNPKNTDYILNLFN